MEKLEKEIKKGGQVYTQLDRTKDAAIYQSDQGHFEVFEVVVAPAGELYGKQYPERETYPGNERFGVNAWCLGKGEESRARKLFEKRAKKLKKKRKAKSDKV